MAQRELEKQVTIADFERFVNRPENADRLFEFIGGEIVEVPSNAFVSAISITIAFFIKLFLREHQIEGYVTGEAGGYMIFGERYAPDVAFISKARQPELAQEGYNLNPPDLAVEIDFPSTRVSQGKLMIKLANYLAAGTTVWIVYPETKQVQLYAPGQPPQILGINDTIDGGEVLPGFTLPVSDIFPE